MIDRIFSVISVTPGRDDQLLIDGTDGTVEKVRAGTEDDGVTPITEERLNIFSAVGWQSATTNHFDEDAYGKDGHRKPGAMPRQMTDAEITVYAQRLLAEQNR